MRAKLQRGCLLALFVAVLPACTQWHYDLGVPLAAAQLPDAGSGVSLATVLTDLGPPQRMSATSAGYVLAWEHWQVKENSVGLSLGTFGADLLSVDWGNARVAGEYLLVSFDLQHRVSASSFSSWDNEAGGGAALQPFIGLVSVVDVDDLVGRMSQHRWGADLMRRLPEAVNAPNSPDTGEAGIEQRGTPGGVGQRSLEMD